LAPKIDWLKILHECKSRIRADIAPLLRAAGQPQSDLGIGAGGDPIKEADLAAEKAIVEVLEEHEVSFTLVSEESGVKKYGRNVLECFVTCDPIDGTTNLVRGVPFYATSIAISAEPFLDKVYAGLVADLFHDVTYVAELGKGAFRDGLRVVPSTNVSLEDAVVGVDLNSYRVDKVVPRLMELMRRMKHLRHFGANALELCYVADGKTDAFIDIRGKLRTTDMAAAWLILREAGALISSPEGEELRVKLDPKQKVEFVASANTKLHRTILGLIGVG